MKPKFNTENYLKNCGFKQIRKGVLEKKIKCPLISCCYIRYDARLHINGRLSLWGGKFGQSVLFRGKFSPDKLNEIYNWLTGEK